MISLLLLGLVVLDPMLDGATRHAITVDGVSRSYRVHEPAAFDGTSPVPVLLVFHGFRQTGRGVERLSDLSALADRQGFLVVYPEGHRRAWNDGQSPRISRNPDADRRKVCDD